MKKNQNRFSSHWHITVMTNN